MTRVRHALGPIAAVWLLCQAGTLVLATAAFGVDAVAATLIECTCAHGGHTDCPMHHTSAPSRSGRGELQCADEADSAVLGSLLGQVGLVQAAPARAIPSAPSGAALPIDVTSKTLRPASPDPPPPRA